MTTTGDCKAIASDNKRFSVRAPSGASAQFTLASRYHGRSNVDPALRRRRALNGTNDYAQNLNCAAYWSLIEKRITGPNLDPQTWSYRYSQNTGTYTAASGLNGYLTGGFAPSMPFGAIEGYGSTDLRTTTVIGPTRQEVHYIDRKFQSPSENQVVATDTVSADGADRLKRVVSKHSRGALVGENWAQEFDYFDAPPASIVNANQANHYTNKAEEKSTLFHTDGQDTFLIRYGDFDNYGFARSQSETNSFGTSRRDTRLELLHDSGRWVLGLPRKTSLSNNGTSFALIDEILYHGTASTGRFEGAYLPYEIRKHGQWIWRFTDYHLGQSGAQADARGKPYRLETNALLLTPSGASSSKRRFQQFEQYKRGLAQKVTVSKRYSDASTQAFTRAVDNFGNVTQVKDLNGNTAYYGYDAEDRLRYVDLPEPWADVWVQWAQSSASSQPIVRTELRCKLDTARSGCSAATAKLESTATFDGLYRVVSNERRDLADNLSIFDRFEYDADHRVTFQAYPSRSSSESDGIELVYDALGRQVQKIEAGSALIVHEYQSGNRIAATDANGNTTTTAYLSYGSPEYQQPLLIASPLDTTTRLFVNVFGDITRIEQSGRVKNGSSLITRTEYRAYDAMHHLCKISRPDVGTTVLSTNAVGELLWRAQGVSSTSNTNCDSNATAAQKIVYSYDGFGDPFKVNYPDASPDLTYSFDEMGNLKQLMAGGVMRTYSYNSLDLLEDERLQLDNRDFRVDYGYDALGHLSHTTYPDGDTIIYTPNAFGQPTAAKLQARTGRAAYSYADGVTYYSTGHINTFRYGNGLVHSTTLNERRIPASLKDGRSGLTALHYDYRFDDGLNVTAITDRVRSAFSITDMVYDGLNRLTNVSGNSAMGNSTIRYNGHGDITTYNSKDSALDYTYNATTGRLDRVTGTGPAAKSLSFTYDSRGNVTANGQRSFGWNLANQLVGSGTNAYTYDGNGRRVKQRETRGTRYSFYSQAGRLLHTAAPEGSVNYIYLGDKLIAKDGVVPRDGDTQHARPFGASLEGEIDDVGFTGHKFDKELGLVYMQARYYDPVIGRFYSNDPVGYTGDNPVMSFNRYLYVNNNPAKYTDPTGNILETPWDLANVGMGVVSFVANVAVGNYRGAALDAAGIGADVVATLAPGVPAGAGVTIRASRAASAAADGVGAVAKSGKSLKDQAADLVPANGNKNRVTLRSENQQLEIDLAGKDHAGIPTPHTKVSPRNHNAPERLQPAYNTSEKKSTLRPSTQEDIRTARRYLERQDQ